MKWVQRGFPTSLAPNRDIGLQLGGDFGDGRFSYQARLPERLERRLEQRDFHRHGHQRRQGVRAAPVHAAVRGERQLRAARARLRHRGHLHGPGRRRDAAAAAVVPLAGPGDVLPLPRSRHHGRDDRGRRAHAHRAAVLLLCGQPRPHRRVHGSLAGRLAHRGGGQPHGHGGHGRLAARGLVLPDRGGGGVPRLQAEDDVLAVRRAPGARSRSSRACSRCPSATTPSPAARIPSRIRSPRRARRTPGASASTGT